MNYIVKSGVKNESYRHFWVRESLGKFKGAHNRGKLLDVGAGQSPYKEFILQIGLEYFSHDFALYVPNNESPGLQNQEWIYPKHDFQCDLLELSQDIKYDVVLCTEVLEHVPDPVAALKHMVNLVQPFGLLIITVPFMSLMHQSPHWYSSGLSPFWFEHWSSELGLEIELLEVSGDYMDFLDQELHRAMPHARTFPKFGWIISKFLQTQVKLTNELRQSGGFGVMVILRKIGAGS